MNESASALLERAAHAYLDAGLPDEAARCLREAGAHQHCAELLLRLGLDREAAVQFEACGMNDVAAWVLAHEVGDPVAARAVLDRMAPERGSALRRAIVAARCAVTQPGAAQVDGGSAVLAVLDDARGAVGDPSIPHDPLLETWAVAVAVAAGRLDRAALLFAAAARAGRPGAAERWGEWSLRLGLGDVLLPADTPQAPNRPRAEER